MHVRKKLSELQQLFMKSLRKGKLLELVVPKSTQLDLIGFIEISNEVNFAKVLFNCAKNITFLTDLNALLTKSRYVDETTKMILNREFLVVLSKAAYASLLCHYKTSQK